jgi:hypothetical protein
MKLPNFLDYPPLNALKRKMGIAGDSSVPFELKAQGARLDETERQQLRDSGIEVDPNALTVLGDGTLAYKDSRVLVYIRDVQEGISDDSLPRYHLMNCSTLQKMSASGRFSRRYVVSTKHDGHFTVNFLRERYLSTKSMRLSVCMNCLSKLRFDGFSYQMTAHAKNEYVYKFKPADFFAAYPMSLSVPTPTFNEFEAPIDNYPDDWSTVSLDIRSKRGWRCEDCSRYLQAPEVRKFLHVHHVNGIKRDVSESNLRALCIRCHAKQPYHARMRALPDFAKYEAIFPSK